MRILSGSLAALAVALAVASCDSFGAPPDDGGAATDGGPTGDGSLEGGSLDGSPDGPLPPIQRCLKADTFSNGPTQVAVLGVRGVESIRFSPDLATGFMGAVLPSETKAMTTLFTVQLNTAGYAISGLLSFDNPGGYDAFVAPLPTSTANAKFLFASSRSGALRTHVATQTGPGAYDVQQQGVPSGLDIASEPYVLPARKAVYFSASDGSPDWDIFRADISSTVDLSKGRLLTNVPTADTEVAPVVTDDEEEIFFSTDRAQPGSGKLEIWRADKEGSNPWEFKVGAAIPELKGKGNVMYPTFISRDSCDLYFIVKNAAGDPGGALFVVKRR